MDRNHALCTVLVPGFPPSAHDLLGSKPVGRQGGIDEMSGAFPGPSDNVRTHGVLSDSLRLTWSAPASAGMNPVLGYQVLAQAGGTSGFAVVVVDTGSAAPQAHVSGLQPGCWCAAALPYCAPHASLTYPACHLGGACCGCSQAGRHRGGARGVAGMSFAWPRGRLVDSAR